ICGRLSHVGDADALLLPRAPLHHLQPARLSAIRRAERWHALHPGYRARRRSGGVGCPESRQGSRRRPLHGRVHGGAWWHPRARALHFGIHAPTRGISVVAASCCWGSSLDEKKREEMKALAAEIGKMFAAEG